MTTATAQPMTSPQTVVLVHGLYMRGSAMGLLARRLRQAGYQTISFTYPSRRSLADNAGSLGRLVDTLPRPVVHFVAHSLGGLVIRRLVADKPDLPPGRVVTLGTPHQGSQAAWGLGAGWLKFILGRSIEGLLGDVPCWPQGRELGSLAGTLNAGMGRLFGPVPVPADGTVAVVETYLAGMADHICLPVSHTGLLVSDVVAAQVSAFLATGRFYHGTAGGAAQPSSS